MDFDLADLLLDVVARRASDLHITAGTHPTVRVRGRLLPLEDFPVLKPADTRELARRRIPVSQLRPPGRPRDVPGLVAPAYRALSRLRWFYVRPPRPVRDAFPDLRTL